MERHIEQILTAASFAPSGDNSQPWRFSVDANIISVYNKPESDRSLYNVNQNTAFIAHGALLQNIKLACTKLGFKPEISLFPNTEQPNLVSQITLNSSTPENNRLCDFISTRATNRKPYLPYLLTSQEKENILNCAHGELVKIVLMDDKEKIAEIARAASFNEQLLFENKIMHEFFFNQIRWTEQDEKTKRNGLYLKTLELLPPQMASFKLFKHWNILKILNKLGISKVVAKDNAKTYSTASVIGAVILANTNNQDYIKAGEIFQRIWLEVTSLGLSLQPITGIIFLANRIKLLGGREFSEQQKKLIIDSHAAIKKQLNLVGENITMLFRIGKSDPPSARSSRLPLQQLLI